MKVLPNDVNSYLAPAQKASKKLNVNTAFDESPLSEIGYTSGGDPNEPCPECEITFEDGTDNPNCFAKRVVFDNNEKFLVKTHLDGSLFDPWNSMTAGTQNKFAKLYGKPLWNFKAINKRSFEFYIKFLQTRNSAWKNNAEREINNG